MLSGPAILRISVLLLVAGVLAALTQYLLPAAPPSPVADPPAAESPPAPSPPAPPPAAPQAAAPPQAAPQTPSQPPSQSQPAPRSDAPPLQMPRDALAFPDAPAADAPAPVARGEAELEQAEETAPPRAVALVDLNTASVADLNRLQGGGAIGRAITAKRPYASVDQLLTKRVLSRSVYERIKDQVTVR